MKMIMQQAQAIVSLSKTLVKFSNMIAHLQGISRRIISVKSRESLQKSVSAAVQTMQNFNKLSGVQQLVSTLHEMKKQNAFLINFQGEILGERIDAVFEEDKDEKDPCSIIEQILFEAGVEIPSTYLSVINAESKTSQPQCCNKPNT